MMRRVFSSAFLCATRAPLVYRCAPLPAASVMTPATMQRRSAANAALASATRRELDDEQQRSEKPQKPEIPSGWTLDRKPGELLFTMRRTYKDEEILLRFLGEDRDENDTEVLDFTVFVTSANKALVFDMCFEDDAVVMKHVSFMNDAKLALDESQEAMQKRDCLYGGPALDQLDAGLVDALISYLKERGVDDHVGRFLDTYHFWAEQAEYEEWLSGINRFVS